MTYTQDGYILTDNQILGDSQRIRYFKTTDLPALVDPMAVAIFVEDHCLQGNEDKSWNPTIQFAKQERWRQDQYRSMARAALKAIGLKA